jgi:predicted membrane protein
MTDFIKKIRLEKWHFYLLGFIIINFGIGQITGYRLNQNLTFILKLILYLTGLILFLTTIRRFKKIAIYYSFYVISGVLTGLFILFGGILLAILSSLALYPIFPKQTKYKTETIKIYDRFQGFMGRCCSYEVVEPKLYIFEKHLGYINIKRPIDADKNEFSLKNNTIIYKYKLDYDGQTTVRDTTEILNFE